jgi:hypothetical protein
MQFGAVMKGAKYAEVGMQVYSFLLEISYKTSREMRPAAVDYKKPAFIVI